MRDIARNFQGQTLVILSVGLDNDEQKWKEFAAKNEMTWLQYRDGGFTGSISKSFHVTPIPHTFTIDADGVLHDKHIGDASIEGTLPLTALEVRESAPASAIFAITNTPRSRRSARVHSRRRSYTQIQQNVRGDKSKVVADEPVSRIVPAVLQINKLFGINRP
jgi:hypothetical protein